MFFWRVRLAPTFFGINKMDLTELTHKAENVAVEYLNIVRLDALEESGLAQLRKDSNRPIRIHKLEFSALIQAIRGLHRIRQTLEARNVLLEAELSTARNTILMHEINLQIRA